LRAIHRGADTRSTDDRTVAPPGVARRFSRSLPSSFRSRDQHPRRIATPIWISARRTPICRVARWRMRVSLRRERRARKREPHSPRPLLAAVCDPPRRYAGSRPGGTEGLTAVPPRRSGERWPRLGRSGANETLPARCERNPGGCQVDSRPASSGSRPTPYCLLLAPGSQLGLFVQGYSVLSYSTLRGTVDG
jgi:hypothetical protein